MIPRKLLLLVLSSVLALPHAAPQTVTSSIAASAPTAVPPLIPYSAVASTSDGKALNGEFSITFLLFKDETGGEPLWTETQTVATDALGRYKVQLGAGSPLGLPLDTFASGEGRWLEVQITGQNPQPRALLMSVPYAMKAADAATLGGLPASAFALATGKAVSGAVTAAPQGASPDAGGAVTTTGGTAGYLPRFSGPTAIVNSEIFDTGASIGIGRQPNPSAILDVNGSTILRGGVQLSRTGNAAPAAGANSFPFGFYSQAYNSATKSAANPFYLWQAEVTGNNTASPAATMNLLFSNNTGAVETGLFFNPNGTIHFAPAQTFPGAGTITGVSAGTGLTGGGTSGKVSLNLDTSRVPLLASNNTFTGTQAVIGSLLVSSAISGSQLTSTVPQGAPPLVVASSTAVPNLNASLLQGLAPNAFATLGGSNNFTGTQAFARVGIGTTTPISGLEISRSATGGLGPVITLTNRGEGQGAEAALDFNTFPPPTTGTYNPNARIAAVDNLNYSDSIVFQSNNPGAESDGLQTNMIVLSNGPVGIGTTAPALSWKSMAAAKLTIPTSASWASQTPGCRSMGACRSPISARERPAVSSTVAQCSPSTRTPTASVE